MSILGSIILGLLAGWLAGVLVKGSGYGVLGDIILGILGAIVGGWITSTLMGVDLTGFNIQSLLVAVLGAIVVIFIARLVSGARDCLTAQGEDQLNLYPCHRRRLTRWRPFARYAGTEVKLEDEEYLVIRENELLAVVANGSA